MRELSIPLDEILDLVNCAEDYGFYDDVLLDAFAGWADRNVSDAEIVEYAADFLTKESQAKGYGEEDRDEAVRRLTEWRDKYCTRGEKEWT